MKFPRLLAVLLALALIGAACSGDSVDDAIQEEAQNQGTGGGDGGGGDGGDDDGTIPNTAIGDIPGVSDECEALANLVLGFSQLVVGGDASQILAAAQSGLPSSLDDEIAIIMEAADQYADALGGIDLTDPNAFATLSPEELAQLEEASQAIDTDAFNNAFEAVSTYAEAECAQFVPGG